MFDNNRTYDSVRRALTLGLRVLELRVSLTTVSAAAERVLDRMTEEKTAVLEAMMDLVALFDQDGRLLFLNQAGRELLDTETGADLSEIIVSDLYAERDAEHLVNEALRHAIDSGSWTGYATLRTRKARTLRTRQVVMPNRGDGGETRGFTLVARPIAESESGPFRTRLEATGVIAAGLAHDLNNTLTPIAGFCELASHHIPDGNPARQYMERVRAASTRARDLAARMLSLSRPGAEKRDRVQLDELVDEVAQWLRAGKPQLRLELETPLPPLVVWADPVQMYQLLLNLLINAEQAVSSPDGVIRVSLSEVSTGTGSEDDLETGSFARLSVSDTGEGIPAEVLDRMFEPFVSARSGDKGMGLGLAVCKDIVSVHGGAVESHAGQGTTFSVYLPLSKS